MIVLAHAGSWAAQLIYFVPVVAFVVWLGIAHWRSRGEEDDSGKGESPGAAS